MSEDRSFLAVRYHFHGNPSAFELTRTHWRVVRCIARHESLVGGERVTCLSMRDLARRSRVSVGTARTAVRRAEAAEIIRVVVRGDGRGRTYRYQVIHPEDMPH